MKHFLLLILLSSLIFKSFGQSDSLRVLSLEECIAIAIDNNLSIRRSVLLREGANINLNQARAGQLPTLNASGSHGLNFGRSIDPVSNQFIAQQISFTSLGGNSSVTLFNWFRLSNTVKQNRLSLESSEFDVEKAKNDISLDIATFYLNVILNRELLENAEYQLNSSNEQLERTKILVKNGSLARTNELELISQVATNEVNLINAQNNLSLAMLSLKQAMMLPAAQKLEISVPEFEISNYTNKDLPDAASIYQIALENMPEIKSADLALQSAQIAVKVAEASYTPTVSLNANLNTNYSDVADRAKPIIDGTVTTTQQIGIVQSTGEAVVTDITTPNVVGEDPSFGYNEQFKANLSKSVSLGVTIPIFNNLRANSNVQRSKITLQQAELTSLERKNQLRQQIESAHNDAYSASKSYNASEKQVEALTETFRSVENQYNLGGTNFTDYQVASNNLFRAKSDLVRAKYDYVFKKKILDFYQGITPTF